MSTKLRIRNRSAAWLAAPLLVVLCGAAWLAIATRGSTVPDRAPDLGHLEQTLDGIIANGLGDGDDAWLLAHACLALGDRVVSEDGQSVVDLLVERFGCRGNVDGPAWGFPPTVDPHRYSFIAELSRAPIDLDGQIDGWSVTRREFLRNSAENVAWDSLKEDGNLCWPLSATYAVPEIWSPPEDVRRDLASAVDRMFDTYGRRLASFADSIRRAPSSRPSEFQDLACGGRHILFALVAAAASDTPDAIRWRESLFRIFPLERRRLDEELRLVRQLGDAPYQRLAASATILGHELEAWGYAAWKTGQRESRDEARRCAALLEEALREMPSTVPADRATNETWTEFYGGICHARAGLHYLSNAVTWHDHMGR